MEWPPEIILGEGTDENFETKIAAINESFTFIDQSIPSEFRGPPTGCSCKDECTLATCSCIRDNQLGQVIDPSSQRLIPLVNGLDFEGPLYQCGPTCGCSGKCSNSLSLQRRLRYPLVLRSSSGKGLGVFAAGPIPVGAYICDYCGEPLLKDQAADRLQKYDAAGQGHALLIVREVLPSGTAALRSCIDATIKGNLARFFNHRQVVLISREDA